MSLSKTIITKQPSEIKLVTMSFSNKMSGTEIITSIDSITQGFADGRPSTDLTFSGQVISGQNAQFLIAGGIVPVRPDIQEIDYKITTRVTTDIGQKLENDGILRVKED